MNYSHPKRKTKVEAKYLGCWLNNTGNPTREVKQRIKAITGK